MPTQTARRAGHNASNMPLEKTKRAKQHHEIKDEKQRGKTYGRDGDCGRISVCR
jgi:hypothetical protein